MRIFSVFIGLVVSLSFATRPVGAQELPSYGELVDPPSTYSYPISPHAPFDLPAEEEYEEVDTSAVPPEPAPSEYSTTEPYIDPYTAISIEESEFVFEFIPEPADSLLYLLPHEIPSAYDSSGASSLEQELLNEAYSSVWFDLYTAEK